MESATLIEQGFELMLYGMGTVVVFLTMLVLATKLMSRLVQRFVPVAAEPSADPGAAAADLQLMAIISAAIHQHRSRQD